jgi:hypothetical protein
MMSNPSSSLVRQNPPRLWGIAYTTLWSADAVAWLVLGSAGLFAASLWVDRFGLSSTTTPYLRAIGVIFIGYALFQFWIGRAGQVPRWAYLLMSVESALWGAFFIAAPFLGIQMNDLGQAISIGGGISLLLMAELWYLARQHS